MPTIKGGFRIKNGQMDKESEEKFAKATGKSIGESMGLRAATKEELTAPKEVEAKAKEKVKEKIVIKKSRKSKKSKKE